MKRRSIALVVLASLVLVGGVAYLLRRGSRDSLKRVDIATFSTALSYAPLYVAEHFKWFEQSPELRGATITYKEFNDRPAISAALTAHEITFLFSAEVPAIMCEAQGNDLQLWGLSSSGTQKVLVRSGIGISQPDQLRGHQIAVLQGTSSHYGLLKILRLAGLSESDVTIANMPPPEARAAFQTGKVDAWAVWAPFVEEEEVRGTGVEIGGAGAWIHSVLSIPTSVATEHPGAARAAGEVIARAKTWIVDHPSEAQQIVANKMGLKVEVVQRAWPKFTWDGALNKSIIQDIQEKADFLADLDKTRGSRHVDVRKELLAPNLPQGDR